MYLFWENWLMVFTGDIPSWMVQKIILIENCIKKSDQNYRLAEAIHLSMHSSMSSSFLQLSCGKMIQGSDAWKVLISCDLASELHMLYFWSIVFNLSRVLCVDCGLVYFIRYLVSVFVDTFLLQDQSWLIEILVAS